MKIIFNPKLVKKTLLILTLLMVNSVTYASDPCLPGDIGCDIDIPIDTHIWIMMAGVVLFTTLTFFKKKPIKSNL